MDIARKKWKIDNVEIKIITFVIELGVSKLLLPIMKVKCS